MPTLTQLAEDILANAKRLDEYTASRGLEATSLLHNTLIDLPDELETSRKQLVDSTQELKALGQGPIGHLLDILFTFSDLLSLRFIYRYNIPNHVPEFGEVSFEEVANAAKVDTVLLRRFLQHGMMNRVFAEPTPGFVAHTATSRLLREDSKALDSVGFLTEDLTPAATKVIEAYEKWPGSGEPNETGFNIENNTNKPFYLEIAKDPERSRRFGAAMRFMTQGSLYDINHLIRSWDWDSYDVKGMTMVDLGGGHGGVSCALARVTTDLKFIVQDLPGTVEEGNRILPAELRGRVKFMAHDFFEVQPVQGADIYFFRFILHNWSDKYATQILQNLMTALKPGARVLIYEFLPSEVAETEWSKKQGRNLDMIQALGWNSLERTVPDWKKLFASTDSRLKFRKTITPPGSTISLIEAIWKP